MKNCIYSGFSDERIKIVENLKKKLNIIPVVNLSSKRDFNDYKNKFNGVVNLDAFDLRFGNYNYNQVDKKFPVDKLILDKLSPYQFTAISLIQDSNNYSFTFDERFTFYYDSLCFWNSVLKNYKIDCFISWTWPHNIIDYTLYLLCKYIYKINIVFLDDVPVLKMTTACNDLENLSNLYKVGNDSNQDKIKIDLKDYSSEEYLNELKIIDQFSFVREFFDLLKIIPIFLKKEISGFKIGKKNIDQPSSRMNILQHRIFRIKSMIKNYFIFKFIDKISTQPNLDEKYILFASNYQPEATSSVTSSFYANQIIAIEILASSLPDDWKIYYREYPKKVLFHWHTMYLKRNQNYYERLKKISNVVITDYKFDLDSLIKNSQAVSSISSNVGFEALKYNKPVILFGSCWYEKMYGVFRIHNLSDCVEALKQIKRNFKFNFKDNDLYINDIKSKNHKFIHRNFYHNIKNSDVNMEMEKITSKIIQIINYNNKNNEI